MDRIIMCINYYFKIVPNCFLVWFKIIFRSGLYLLNIFFTFVLLHFCETINELSMVNIDSFVFLLSMFHLIQINSSLSGILREFPFVFEIHILKVSFFHFKFWFLQTTVDLQKESFLSFWWLFLCSDGQYNRIFHIIGRQVDFTF